MSQLQVNRCVLAIADQNYTCDAVIYWLKIADKLDFVTKEKGISGWGWGPQIKIGHQYFLYEFVDDESGEMTIMRVKIAMDNYFRKFNLYPSMVAEAIDRYTVGIKNNQWY